MRLTYARFDELDAQAEAENWAPGWRMSHKAREANRQNVLAGRLDRDLWVFAYGSLIWDPAVHVDQIRLATLAGWRRRFCMRVTGSRGTVDRPGLMAALDEGGDCGGVAFRIPREIVDRETEIMWMREMFTGSYRAEFLSVTTPAGRNRGARIRDGPEQPPLRPRHAIGRGGGNHRPRGRQQRAEH